MITAKINGNEVELEENTDIRQYLEAQGHNAMRVAVEQNGAIVPQAAYAGRIIKAGDVLEIVSFVGGG